MSGVVHARGLGQVNPLCKGGKIGSLGPVRPGAEVTCAACQLQPYVNAIRGVTAAFVHIGSLYTAAFRQLGHAIADAQQRAGMK